MKKVGRGIGFLLGLHRPFLSFFRSSAQRYRGMFRLLRQPEPHFLESEGSEIDTGPGKVRQLRRGGIILVAVGFLELFLIVRAHFFGLGLVFAVVYLSLPLAMFVVASRFFRLARRIERLRIGYDGGSRHRG